MPSRPTIQQMRLHPGRYWRVLSHRQGHGGHLDLRDVGDFDELVVGDWFHLEQMDDRYWWMHVGETNFDIGIPEDINKPITVYNRELDLYLPTEEMEDDKES